MEAQKAKMPTARSESWLSFHECKASFQAPCGFCACALACSAFSLAPSGCYQCLSSVDLSTPSGFRCVYASVLHKCFHCRILPISRTRNMPVPYNSSRSGATLIFLCRKETSLQCLYRRLCSGDFTRDDFPGANLRSWTPASAVHR